MEQYLDFLKLLNEQLPTKNEIVTYSTPGGDIYGRFVQSVMVDNDDETYGPSYLVKTKIIGLVQIIDNPSKAAPVTVSIADFNIIGELPKNYENRLKMLEDDFIANMIKVMWLYRQSDEDRNLLVDLDSAKNDLPVTYIFKHK